MKRDIIFHLEKAGGGYVSGADIARSLGVSRMAVSKAVGELRREGAVIESSTKCGYRLLRSPDTLYSECVRAHLKEDLCVYCHDVIGSTNEEAKKLAGEGARHGTAVIAKKQTCGRGRRGRSFHSPDGTGLYMSIILKPDMYDREVMYTVAAAVAVREAISKYNADAKIKWVNDIYIGHRKVCGILCEAVSELESGTLSSVICGIGINLNMPEGGFPEDITDKAGAVSDSYIPKAGIAADIINELEKTLAMPSCELISEYQKYMMLTGRKIYYTVSGKSRCGTVDGVDMTGGLVVRDDEGNVEILRSGEVQLEKF